MNISGKSGQNLENVVKMIQNLTDTLRILETDQLGEDWREKEKDFIMKKETSVKDVVRKTIELLKYITSVKEMDEETVVNLLNKTGLNWNYFVPTVIENFILNKPL